MSRSSIGLLIASLVLPALVLVPWALFGDAVPRALVSTLGVRGFARLLVALGLGALVMLSIAVYRLIGEARRSAEPRRELFRLGMGALGLVALGLITTGAIFGYYSTQHSAATALCWPARRASTIGERRAALEAAAPHVRRVSFFNEHVYACEDLQQELAELDRGLCPELVPSDARCSCGKQRFPEDWPEPASPRCDAYDDKGDFVDEKRLRRPRGY